MPEKKQYSSGFLDAGFLAWLPGNEKKEKQLGNPRENDGLYSCKPSLFHYVVALSIL